MYSLSQLEKQQVGLRLPRYLIEQLDELASSYSLNRTDLIFEAIRSYLEKQKEERFYEEFAQGVSELKQIQKGGKAGMPLSELIDEL